MIYSFHIVYYTLRRISCNTNFTDSGQGNIIIRSTIKVETIPKIERRNNGDRSHWYKNIVIGYEPWMSEWRLNTRHSGSPLFLKIFSFSVLEACQLHVHVDIMFSTNIYFLLVIKMNG